MRLKKVLSLTLFFLFFVSSLFANPKVPKSYQVKEITGIKIDGFLKDWKDITPFSIPDKKEDIWIDKYMGRSDLSGDIYLAYDKDNLYLAVKVIDDILSHPYEERSSLWKADSLQVGFEPENKGRTSFDEYILGLDAFGKEIVYRNIASFNREVGLCTDIELKVKKEDTGYIYEAKFPFKVLSPFNPSSDNSLGFTILINDNDGKGRKGWIEWTPGIGKSKDPSSYGNIILAKKELFNVSFYFSDKDKDFYKDDEEINTVLSILTLRQTGKYKVKFEVKDRDKRIFTEEKEVEVEPGSNSIPFSFNGESIPSGEYKIEAVIYKGEDKIKKELSFHKLDKPYIGRKILEAKRKRRKLEELLEEAKSKGIDITYPKASWTLNKLFEPYIRDDLDKGKYFKANYEVDYIISSTDRAIQEITEWLKAPSKQITVPDISVSNLRIEDGEFYQGKEPVLLLGSMSTVPSSDFNLFHSLGFNVIDHIFFGPRYTTPVEGELSKSFFEDLDKYFKEAEKNNITIEMLLSIHYLSSWVYEKYPSIFTCGYGCLPFCITNPETKVLFRNWLKEVIPLVKDYPNLLSYSLANEPAYLRTGYCSYCRKAFQEYLQREYKTITNLNKSWKTDYKSFSEVGIPSKGGGGGTVVKPEKIAPINRNSKYDWQRFNQYRMSEFFSFLKETIREKDKRTPCHWESPLCWGLSEEDYGVDWEEIGKRGEISGCDVGIAYFPGRGKYALELGRADASGGVIALDLMKSLVPDKPIFNTEWHNIGHVFGIKSYKRALGINNDPDYVKAHLWLGYLHGYSAGCLWIWLRERQAGEWNLLDLPQSLESASRTFLDIKRLTKEVIAFHKAPKEVVILFSMTSKLQSPGYIRELTKVYDSLYFLDTHYGFISENQIEEGLLNKYKLLIIPKVEYVSDNTYNKIKDYLRKGGNVVIVKDSLSFDERGNRRDISELLTLNRENLYLTEPLSTEEYTHLFDRLLDKIGIERPFRVTDIKNSPIDGVEFRVVKKKGNYLAYLINLNRKKVKIKLNGKEREVNRVRELISNQTISFPLEIEPLKVLLIEIKK